MIGWIKGLFSKAVRVFREFIAMAFPILLQAFIAALKEYAVSVVIELSKTDFNDEQKRKQAFDWIRDEAVRRGMKFKTSWINILIELCVSYVKNKGLM